MDAGYHIQIRTWRLPFPWTLQNTLSPGLADEKLVRKAKGSAACRASPSAPSRKLEVKAAKRPVVQKRHQEWSLILRICGNLKFSAADHHETLQKSPDSFFRAWASNACTEPREWLLQCLQRIDGENLVRGFGPKGKTMLSSQWKLRRRPSVVC